MQCTHSHLRVHLYPLHTLLVLPCCVSVCVCMCLCVCTTDCAPPQCSRWPPRPSAPLCIVLFLPSVEVKKNKTKTAVLALRSFCDSAQICRQRDDENEANSYVFSFSCVCVCMETLRLHLPGSLCSQRAELDAPEPTHTHNTSRSLITFLHVPFRMYMSCKYTLPASALEVFRL